MSRRKPPAERSGITTKITAGAVDGYVTVNFYEDDQPCEVFIKVSKVGSFSHHAFDVAATLASHLLQNGLPTEEIVRIFSHRHGDGGDLWQAIADAITKSLSIRGTPCSNSLPSSSTPPKNFTSPPPNSDAPTEPVSSQTTLAPSSAW